MSIVELDINDLISVGKFKKFYDETFVHSFDINEIQSFEQYLQIKIDEVKYLREYEYHFCFIEKDEQYIACFIYIYFPKLQMMYAEYSCVKEEYRRQGLLSNLFNYAVEKHDIEYVFNEIEKRNKTNILIWKKFGFKKIPIDYKQLQLSKDKKPLDNELQLNVLPMNDVVDAKFILAEDVLDFIHNYYKYFQHCEKPEDTDVVKELVNLTTNPHKWSVLKLVEIEV